MSENTPFGITDSTLRGLELLKNSPTLQRAITTCIESPTLADCELQNAELLGEGRHSRVYAIDGVALKISSHATGVTHSNDQTTSKDYLSLQFTTLRLLREFIDGNSEGIHVPEQFFFVATPDVDIVGQQFMHDWVSLERQTVENYGPARDVSPASLKEIDDFTINAAYRLKRVFDGFPLISYINDLVTLKGEQGNLIELNGDNILVPKGARLTSTTPLCVIDQPTPVIFLA